MGWSPNSARETGARSRSHPNCGPVARFGPTEYGHNGGSGATGVCEEASDAQATECGERSIRLPSALGRGGGRGRSILWQQRTEDRKPKSAGLIEPIVPRDRLWKCRDGGQPPSHCGRADLG
jgi:hypothetical protein